jgi:LPS-assembly protein
MSFCWLDSVSCLNMVIFVFDLHMKRLHKGKAKRLSVRWLTGLTMLSVLHAISQPMLHVSHAVGHNKVDTIPQKTIEQTGAVLQENVNSLSRPNVAQPAMSALDTTRVPKNDTLALRISKDTLAGPVHYSAEDSVVFDVPSGNVIFYGKTSNIKYVDNELTAPHITFSQRQNEMEAFLLKDSSGKVISYPTFNQGDFKTISDTIRFNMKTGKGITKGTYTQQGEMFVYGEKIKKVDNDVFYAKNGRFTTCNLDTPHFSFVSNKIKFINKKVAFTGPVHPEIEGVPLPVLLPFGIYPLTQGRHSGFMAPSFTANDQLGLAMEGIGYYKILSDNWDVVARGTLYSYGGWTFNVSPRYLKKYRYQGNFSFNMQRLKNGFRGDPDFSSSTTFNIRWNHSADMKARPGVTFTAAINAGSSKFNQQVPNSPRTNFTNALNSSVSYGKVWKNKPFNFQISANHNQNSNLNRQDLSFPDMNFNLNTQYPFRKKEAVGDAKWYENIGIALNTTVKGNSFFFDTLANISGQLAENFKWGAAHSIPITLSLPALGPLQIAPNVSYQEKWYQEKFIRSWNPVTRKMDTLVKNGLFTARDMNYGIGVSTRIFGMVAFKKSSKVQAIRHEIRPTLSLNYKPNLNANSYYTTQVDTTGRTTKYSYYERSVYGSFSDVRFGGMNFGIDNVLQMKVRNKKDTGESTLKKVSLIDGLSITSSYNLLDSFHFGIINLNARTNLFEKLNITAGAQFDPYQVDSFGRRITRLLWQDKPGSLGRMTSGSISLQSRFNGGDGKTSSRDSRVNNAMNNTGMPMDEFQQEAAYIRNNPGEFADFSIPWSLDFQYSLRFSRIPVSGGQFQTSFNQDVNFNGDVNLTPKWKVGMSGSYNITQKQLGVLALNLSRDLHCWQMSIAISPVGRYKFFTINISPKSSMLRDIKVNRTRFFYDF